MTRALLNESIAAAVRCVKPKVKAVTQTHFASHAILTLSPAEKLFVVEARSGLAGKSVPREFVFQAL